MRLCRIAILLAASALASASTLNAQCPDGTPPPCSPAAAPARRDPPLDERTWLVLPFENTARDTASDLVRNVSVSLLYQEMARWQDVRVIPDARVADLLRRVPAAEQARLGLETASDLARRAGARRVVLGSYLAVRGRATVIATVYDVRAGRPLRVVREAISGLEAAAALDSLGAAFSRLARGILAVPAGAQGGAGGPGTTSIEAYRAYASGMAAINRFAIDSALVWLDRAIVYDSNFALAHLRRWQFSSDTVTRRQDLQAAIRLAESLPPRERLLVEGSAASGRGDYEQLCGAANRLVADDSTAADGWVMLSRCYGDSRVFREGGTVRLRGDPVRALRASERAYALAPTSIEAFSAWGTHLAFSAALYPSGNPDNPYRMECADEGISTFRCLPDRLYRLSLITVADSFVVTVQPWWEARRAPAERAPEAVAGWQRRALRAREGVERFRQSAPDSWFLSWLGAVLACETGDTAAAAGAFGRGAIFPSDTSGLTRLRSLNTGLLVSLARGRMAVASAYADSVLARPGNASPWYHTLFGRFGEGADTTADGRQNGAWRQILAGVLPTGFDTLETRISARLTGPTRDDFLQLSTLAAFHMRRTGPALDTAAAHPIKRAQAWIARRDTVRAREALVEFDRELAARHVATGDDGGWLFSAEAHLELGDSAVALERLREFARRWVYMAGQFSSNILEQWYWHRGTQRLWGRTWLLFGDLAMAAGQQAEARRAYRMVVGFWEHGDPPVQPLVARARAAQAQLGN
jgi:tetratricopeptide (TPR) repeat protein